MVGHGNGCNICCLQNLNHVTMGTLQLSKVQGLALKLFFQHYFTVLALAKFKMDFLLTITQVKCLITGILLY